VKIAAVIGARPQFVKAAVISRVLQSTRGVEEVLIHTGQHYDESMSEVFFKELELRRPDYHLGIGSGTHGMQTGRMLEAIDRVLLRVRPDWVLVYGDTNSTLAGALAAAKLHLPMAHVEAGLRSFNRRMPEEINRVLTDHASDRLFAPTEAAVKNLKQEGIPEERVYLVGDVMYDAALYYGAKAERESQILQRLGLETKGYSLATVHRAENTDNPERLRAIFKGLGSAAERMPVILPLHPRTRAALEREGLLREVTHRICLIGPVGYLDMVMLEKNARLVVTDSGGVQKEAFFYRVPCVTLRSETEWVELVELGWNRLIPPLSVNEIVAGVEDALGKNGAPGHPYGDGNAAEKIVAVLGR
jgi:UDP-GlcNAc3NAcA epimerase